MATKKPTKKTAPKHGPGGGLRFVGERPFRGAPARDLTPHDIARLAYRRTLSRIGADGHRPSRAPDPAVVDEITAELIGSGLYEPEV